MKKISFAPLFLIAISFVYLQFQSIINSPLSVISVDLSVLTSLVVSSVGIMLSAYLFVLFASFADDWRIINLVNLLAASFAFIFFPVKFAILTAAGILICATISYSLLTQALKSYLNFQPISLLSPQIKNFSKFLAVIFSLIYFLSINQVINANGFQIPDSIIDSAIKLTPSDLPTSQSTSNLPQISQDQIDLLKKNPQLLKQYGLDANQLDQMTKPQSLNDTLKKTLKDQLQSMVQPYLVWIPAVLTLAFYLTLVSILSLSFLLLYLLIPLSFLVLEETGFIHFTTETRVVKKIVV